MATNNSTIEAEIVGATIAITVEVQLIAGRDKAFNNGTGQLYKVAGSGTFQPVGPQTNIVPTGDGFSVNKTITYTDSAVTNQTTYRYFYEVDITERSVVYE